MFHQTKTFHFTFIFFQLPIILYIQLTLHKDLRCHNVLKLYSQNRLSFQPAQVYLQGTNIVNSIYINYTYIYTLTLTFHLNPTNIFRDCTET